MTANQTVPAATGISLDEHAGILKTAESALEELAQALTRGESETLKAYLRVMGKFHRYSVWNMILIALQRPQATRVAGFGAWRKLGRHVVKGEHGIRILAPVVRRRDADDDEDVVVAFRSAYVFDVSQTSGRPLPDIAWIEGNPGQYTQRLRDFIVRKNIALEYSSTIGTALGFSSGGRIVIRTGLTPAEEFGVLAHETAHEILHKGTVGRPDASVVETEAEAVAFVVGHAIGLDCQQASADYVTFHGGDRKTLMRSLQRIQRTASEIIEAIQSEAAGFTPAAQSADPAIAA